MEFLVTGFDSSYEIESLARMLFGTLVPFENGSGDCCVVALRDRQISVALTRNQATVNKTQSVADDEKSERAAALLLYFAALEAGIKPLRWGVLTGIRPIKLFHVLLESGKSDSEVCAIMQNQWAISPEMAQLATAIARREQAVNQRLSPEGYSLYVSIPFCPQRCSYCSFVSHSVEKDRSLLPSYVSALCGELGLLAQTMQKLGKKLDTVYIGGGTPTVLDAPQLDQLLQAIANGFDTKNTLEYTVEAGRPDTITTQKLELLKAFGVNRISVNPQTMNDAILKDIGRSHTAADVENAFWQAQKIGFEVINMDLIAGLPNDTPQSFFQSVDRVLALAPQNVTVHSLTVKRASDLAQSSLDRSLLAQSPVASMVDYARSAIEAQGYFPYYLYRQKGTVDNLDNTGYAKPQTECIYNVLMMDETQPVLAAGAGSVTRLCQGKNNIQRLFAHKLPYEYIRDYDRIKLQQQKVVSFYENGHTDQKPSY